MRLQNSLCIPSQFLMWECLGERISSKNSLAQMSWDPNCWTATMRVGCQFEYSPFNRAVVTKAQRHKMHFLLFATIRHSYGRVECCWVPSLLESFLILESRLCLDLFLCLSPTTCVFRSSHLMAPISRLCVCSILQPHQ